ncbi:MAG: DUF1194 domain-containing protein [bacterium]|nr:DUF1194 domain-containing protein [bacterium]
MRLGLVFLATILAMVANTNVSHSKTCEVDVSLALYMDVSGSVSKERFDIQRRGYAAALKSEEVIEAIKVGPTGSIEISVTQWAGPTSQETTVKWTVVSNPESMHAFAYLVETMERSSLSSSTSITGAMDHAGRAFEDTKCFAPRLILDISGDGSDDGESREAISRELYNARKALIEKEITINGLAIYGVEVEPDIGKYYRDHVIGGVAAFVEPVTDPNNLDAFIEAFMRKLIRELIASQ